MPLAVTVSSERLVQDDDKANLEDVCASSSAKVRRSPPSSASTATATIGSSPARAKCIVAGVRLLRPSTVRLDSACLEEDVVDVDPIEPLGRTSSPSLGLLDSGQKVSNCEVNSIWASKCMT